jgi:uncharacterized membrane protein
MTKSANKQKKSNLKLQVQEPEKEYWLHILIGLTIIAAILRFYHLDFNSLWLDEISTYKYSIGSFENMKMMMTTGTDYAPPLFFFLEHFVLQGLGTSELTIRLLPALFGTLTIPVIYFVGKEFWDEKVGLITAGIFTFSPFLIYYSQEARAYAMALLLISIEFYFFLKAAKTEEVKDWILFGVFAGVAFWTHYYTVVFTAMLFTYMIIRIIPTFIIPTFEKDMKTLKLVLIAAGAMFLVTLPVIVTMIPLFFQISSSAPTYGIHGVGLVYATFNQMSGFSDNITYALLFVCALGIIIAWKRDNFKGYASRYPYTSLLLVWIMTGTFLISIYLSYKMPMMPRYIIFLTIPFTLGIALVYIGLRELIPQKISGYKIVVVLIAIFAIISVPYYLNYYQNFSKEDWKGIAKDLESITLPGDTVVSVPRWIGYPLDYYYSSKQDQTIEKGVETVDALNAIRKESNQSVYYILTNDIYAGDPQGTTVEWLKQNSVLTRNYGSVWVLKGV